MQLYAILALDLARERTLEAERRARLLGEAGPMRPSLPRRVLGRLAAWADGASAGHPRGADRAAMGGGTAT